MIKFLDKFFLRSNNLNYLSKSIKELTKNSEAYKIFDAINSYSEKSEIRYVGGCIRKIINNKFPSIGKLKCLNNDLEQIVFKQYPSLAKLKKSLTVLQNILFARMTGSGSAIVAYFKSKKRCLSAKKKFNKKYKNYWCIASKTI